MNLWREPTTHDGRKTSEPGTLHLLKLLREGLMKTALDGTILPAQAERVEISEDGLIYDFYLGENFWSNGEEVLASDFANSWKENLSPSFCSPTSYFFDSIQNGRLARDGLISLDEVGIEVVDPKHLRVTLEHPNAAFLSLTTSPFSFPYRYKDSNPSNSLDLISNGPFYISDWKEQNDAKKIILKRNPYYSEMEFPLEGIELNVINDPNTAYELFMQGELDFVDTLYSPISPALLENAFKAPSTKRIISKAVAVNACNFNTTSFPLNNLNIRKALSLAIDKELLAKAFKGHRLLPAYSVIPDSFKPFAYHTFPQGDPLLAREYLEQGLKELEIDLEHFPKLKLLYHLSKENAIIHQIAQILQQTWYHHLGIEVALEGHDLKTALSVSKHKEFDINLILWTAYYPHPLSFLERFREKTNAKNYTNWESNDFKAAIHEIHFAKNSAEESRAVVRGEQILAEAIPLFPILFLHHSILVDRRVHGLEIDNMGRVRFERTKTGPPQLKAYEP